MKRFKTGGLEMYLSARVVAVTLLVAVAVAGTAWVRRAVSPTGNTDLGKSGLSENSGNSIGDSAGAGYGDQSNAIRVGTAKTQRGICTDGFSGASVSRGVLVYVSATGQLGTETGGSSRFTDNGNGTVTDHQTGLMWEQTTGTVGGARDHAEPRNVNNRYTWSASGTVADGTVFTDFLPRLNGLLCSGTSCDGLGGHSDWRLPTEGELEGILSAEYPCAVHPCVDGKFGPTQPSYYWSSTLTPTSSRSACFVSFSYGGAYDDYKDDLVYVRAVRGGLL